MVSNSISKNKFKNEYNTFLNKWLISCLFNLTLFSIWSFSDNKDQYSNTFFNIALFFCIISLIYSLAGAYIYNSLKNKYVKNVNKSNQNSLNDYLSIKYDGQYFKMYSIYIFALFIIIIVSNYDSIDWTYLQLSVLFSLA